MHGQTRLYVSPGIKMGYAFGKDGGFTFGYELSFVVVPRGSDDSRYGLVIDYDWPKNAKRLHIGLEYIYRYTGVDVGPSFIWEEGKQTTGLSIIPFGCPELLIPYYQYTLMPGSHADFHDAGMYLKFPVTKNMGWRN